MKGCDGVSAPVPPPPPSIPPPPPPPPPPPVLLQKPNDDRQAGGSIICSDHVQATPENLGREAYYTYIKHPDTITKYLEGQCYLSFYRPVTPVLQIGPRCGMVALTMAAPLLNKSDITAEMIFEKSVKKKYSMQGELFSADWLIRLAEDILDCNANQLEMTEGRSAVIWKMLKGSLLLVPYDADKNHQPCLKKGHKAHWALITGFFVVLDRNLEKILQEYLPPDPMVPNLYHCQDHKQLAVVQHQIVKCCKITYVYGHQGKSKYPGTWLLDELLASNANLRELGPERSQEIEKYVLPNGGILSGLCGKIVHINSKKK